jgi:hypothetical protein
MEAFVRNISKQNNEFGSTGIFSILSCLRWKLINLGPYVCILLEVLQHFGETSVNFYEITRRNIPDDSMLHSHGRETSNLTPPYLLHRSYEVAVVFKVCRYLRREMCDVASALCRVHIRRVPPSLINWSSDNISAHSHRTSRVYRVSVTSRNVNTKAFTRFSFAPVWQAVSLNTTKTREM